MNTREERTTPLLVLLRIETLVYHDLQQMSVTMISVIQKQNKNREHVKT